MSDYQSILASYTPPKSLSSITTHQKTGFLGTNGRIGRLRYIAWLTIGFIVMTGGTFLVSTTTVSRELMSLSGGLELYLSLSLLYFLLVVALMVFCTMPRLQDFNCNKWVALIQVIPFLNVLTTLLFMLIPGTEKANKYGSPPPANSGVTILFSSIFFLFFGFLLVKLLGVL